MPNGLTAKDALIPNEFLDCTTLRAPIWSDMTKYLGDINLPTYKLSAADINDPSGVFKHPVSWGPSGNVSWDHILFATPDKTFGTFTILSR